MIHTKGFHSVLNVDRLNCKHEIRGSAMALLSGQCLLGPIVVERILMTTSGKRSQDAVAGTPKILRFSIQTVLHQHQIFTHFLI